jgi:signal transduction histidine kinase
MRPLSLRAHFLIGAMFWTFGLFGLAVVLWHITLGHREPPATFFWFMDHAHAYGLLCVVSLTIGAFQVRRGWQSISRIRAGLAALHATPGPSTGSGQKRRLDGAFPSEIQPLVTDLNALLDQRDVMVEQARASAGDLAHGLKTPLAVLMQEAERARRDGPAELAEILFEQIGRMRRQVDAQLARTRVDLSKHRAVSPVNLGAAVAGIVRTLSHLHAERGLTFDVDVDAALTVLVAREDLDEIAGNLLDNACKWAKTTCRVSARSEDGRVAVLVEDDGPGIAEEMRAHVLARGARADEAVPGTGLGLSIVRDLTEAYGGTVALAESPLGGLRATVSVPA